MQAQHQFEDADTGDELILEPDMTYTVVTTFVELVGPEDPTVYFTHRIRVGVTR